MESAQIHPNFLLQKLISLSICDEGGTRIEQVGLWRIWGQPGFGVIKYIYDSSRILTSKCPNFFQTFSKVKNYFPRPEVMTLLKPQFEHLQPTILDQSSIIWPLLLLLLSSPESPFGRLCTDPYQEIRKLSKTMAKYVISRRHSFPSTSKDHTNM